jgi:hypothetical protein
MGSRSSIDSTVGSRARWHARPLALASLCMLGSAAENARAQGTRPVPDLSPTAAAHTLESEDVGALVEAHSSRAAPSRDPLPEPELPGLERHGDGSYRFRGLNFSAVIAKDGQVKFRDFYIGFSRGMKPLPSQSPDLSASAEGARVPVSGPWLSLQFHLDLYGYLESKLGNDPHLAERRWFMERTRELRETLAERALVDTLRGNLLRIWNQARLSLTERKRETFELWSNAPRGKDGDAIRQLVEAFVRERCPVGTASAFRKSELKRFNQGRTPEASFAPYRSSDERAE